MNDQAPPSLKAKVEAARLRSRITRGRPRAGDNELIKQKLLQAALHEFMERGYGNASLTRIVNLAGSSKSTLYSRYSSKEELFLAIIHEQMQQLSPSASLQSEAGLLPLEDGLVSYASHMLKHSLLGELRGVDRLIYSEAHQFPELAQAAADRTALGIKRIEKFIMDSSRADAVPCRNPGAVAETFIFMIRGWYVNAILSNQKITAVQCEQWARKAVNVIIGGRSGW